VWFVATTTLLANPENETQIFKCALQSFMPNLYNKQDKNIFVLLIKLKMNHTTHPYPAAV
jgi:hypothetical protein